MHSERWFGLGFIRSPDNEGGVGTGGGATGGNGAGSGGAAAPVAPTAPSAAGGAAPGIDGAPPTIAPPMSWDLEGFDDEDGGSGDASVASEEPPAQVEPPAPKAPEPAPEPKPEPAAAQPAQLVAPASQRRPGVQGYLDEMVQNKDQIVQAVAEMRFKMSDEDVKAVEEDFVKALPMFAGRVWFEAYTSAVNFMNQQIPSIMRGEMQKFGRSFEAENQFYKAWPGLDRGKHHDHVKHFGRVYRQAYPQASVEDFVRDVGTMVASQLGLANANRPPASGGQGPAATSGANGARRVVDAFVPAGTGGGQQGRPPAGRAAASANPFEGLGMEFEE